MSLEKETTEDRIVLKGRAGLEYYDRLGKSYFIDSEILATEDYDYAIYSDSLVELNTGKIPNLNTKKEILNRIEYLCKLRNMKPKFFLDNL